MTVDELIKKLQEISEEGHGSSRVLHNAYYYEEVDLITIEKNYKDEKYILLDKEPDNE